MKGTRKRWSHWKVLTRYLEGVMVSIFVDIEEGEDLEDMVGFNHGGKRISTIDRNEMGRTEDGIHMDHCKRMITSGRRLHHPHSGVVVGCIANSVEPADNSAWIVYTPKSKGKKREYLSDIHAPHSVSIWVSNDKHTIFAWMSISPFGGHTNVLAFHPTNPTQVTRCKEC